MKTKTLIIVLAGAIMSFTNSVNAQQANQDALSAAQDFFPAIAAFPQHDPPLFETDANGNIITEPALHDQLPVDTSGVNFRAMKRASDFQKNLQHNKMSPQFHPVYNADDHFGGIQKKIQ